MRIGAAARRMVVGDVVRLIAWGFVLAALTFRPYDFAPTYGLDPSWRAGLHLAAHSDLIWGRDLVFTYGPLGFLEISRLYYDLTAAASLLWNQGGRVLALAVVFALARRGLGPVLAAGAILLIAPVLETPHVVLAFALTVAVVARRDRHEHARALLVVLGVLAGVALLVKLNLGVTIAAIGAIAAVGGPGTRPDRARDLGWWGGAFTLTAALGWVATGQPLTAFVDYSRHSMDVVSGYSEAMQYEASPSSEYTMAAIVVLAGLMVCVRAARDLPGRSGAALSGLWIVFCFLQFKAGFVRHDVYHSVIFFTTVPLAALTLARVEQVRSHVAITYVAGLVALLAATGETLPRLFSPLDGVRETVAQVRDFSDAGFRNATRGRGRDAIVANVAIPENVLADVRDRTVHVHPVETSVVWAYGLRWRPLPVFQSYNSYTSELDRLNADVLGGNDGPQRVLMRPDQGIDTRWLAFDAPLVTLRFLCQFSPSAESPTWVALTRGPDRCSIPRVLREVRLGWGDTVPVPAPRPGTMIVAETEGLAVSGFERFRSTFYKAFGRSIRLDDVEHRLVPGTAAGPLVLRASAGIDLPAQIALIPQASSISFQREGEPRPGKHLRVRFLEVLVESSTRREVTTMP